MKKTVFKMILCGCLMANLSCEKPGGEANATGKMDKRIDNKECQPASWVDAFSVEHRGQWNHEAFGAGGEVNWTKEGHLQLMPGSELTGIVWQGELPELPYEIEYEARKRQGEDFFGALTFPVRDADECVSFINGGWGGAVVGISCIDDLDASNNETTQYMSFERDQWYRFKIRVEQMHLRVEVDGKVLKVKNKNGESDELLIEGRKLSLRPGPIESCAPLGLAAWQTEAEVRNLRWRSLSNADKEK